jgi:hypothetical protein
MARRIFGVVLAVAASVMLASEPRVRAETEPEQRSASREKRDAQALAFNGSEYFHRWSKQGQHEFTPKGDEDLSKWKDMMTVNVHAGVRTGEGLADIANRVIGNYKAHGHIMRTLSKPRTDTSEAEHFAAAVLQGEKVFEVAFARFLLFEGRGIVVVHSKRFYGDGAQAEMTTWFKANAVKIEQVLLSWNGIPSLETLNRLQ